MRLGPRRLALSCLALGAALLLIAALAACDSSAPTPSTVAPGAKCGTERWAVKTLSDRDAPKVDLTPVPGAIADLVALQPPKTLPASSRIPPTELTTYSITAVVVEAKLEDDHDFHVVIADPADSSRTMIVEFPDTACSGAISSAEAEQMKAARDAFVQRYGQPKDIAFTSLDGQAVFTGVAFFDFQHGQRGVAPNAIELHPVLGFQPLP